MSSGRFVSARFSWSFFWMESRVTSTAGLADLSVRSCFLSSSFSSWEPKLLGSVLLRWRTTGPRSSSDIFSFVSEQGKMSNFSFLKCDSVRITASHQIEMRQSSYPQRCTSGSCSPFNCFRNLAKSFVHLSTSGLAALSLWEGWEERKAMLNLC